jgi:hypothetical protein
MCPNEERSSEPPLYCSAQRWAEHTSHEINQRTSPTNHFRFLGVSDLHFVCVAEQDNHYKDWPQVSDSCRGERACCTARTGRPNP